LAVVELAVTVEVVLFTAALLSLNAALTASFSSSPSELRLRTRMRRALMGLGAMVPGVHRAVKRMRRAIRTYSTKSNPKIRFCLITI